MERNDGPSGGRRWGFCLMFLLIGSAVPAQPAPSPLPALSLPPAQALSPLAAERAYRRWDLDELQWSPDGSRLAFTVTGPGEGIRMDRNLWVFHAQDSSLRQYTFSLAADHHPRWSPDGRKLAFLSHRTGQAQIHLLDMKGGEARVLTGSETGVVGFEWSPDGSRIAFAAKEPPPRKEADAPRLRFAGLSFGQEERNTQLWIVDVETAETRQLTRGPWRMAHPYWAPNFSWSPDGDRIYVSGTEEPVPERLDNRIYMVDVRDGRREELARPRGGFGRLQVSPDGKALAYLGPREDAFEYDDLYLLPLAGGPARNLTASSIDRRIWADQWLSKTTLLVLALDGFQASFYRCHLDGSVERVSSPPIPPSGHSQYRQPFAAASGLVAFVGEKTEVAPELWLWREGEEFRKVSHFNREWESLPVVPLQIFTYPSFDGTPIEAGLLKPPGSEQAVPLVVLVHGGPSAKFSDRFSIWAQMLVSRGMAVLMPNIRGSTGYGYRFLTLNRYDWGGADFQDVMAGVDVLIAQGIADPQRLGIGGWSYGGYMTAWAVTQTDRFQAAVAGAPMTNLVSEYGTEARWSHFYDTWYLGTPYQNLDLFVSRSPVTHVSRVRTPTLLLVGERDDNTPLGQCLEFFRGLQMHDVKADLVIYEGAGHFPTDDRQRLDVYERFVNWFSEHLRP